MMRITLVLLTILLLLVSINIYCSGDSINAILTDIDMISDGTSKYGNPKISPNGNKVLATKNKDSLIFIDCAKNREVLLSSGANYYKYYWVDNANIYYYELRKPGIVELGILNINNLEKRILFTNRDSTTLPVENSSSIPTILAGRHYISFDLKEGKVYRIKGDRLIELTDESGVYYGFVLSNNEERIIIHKNDGYAYNFDFQGQDSYWKLVNGIVTSWSPDGKYLLYFIDRGEGLDYTSELYICTNDGRTSNKLTNTESIIEMWPSWSKEVDKIAYINDTDHQLYVATIEIK